MKRTLSTLLPAIIVSALVFALATGCEKEKDPKPTPIVVTTDPVLDLSTDELDFPNTKGTKTVTVTPIDGDATWSVERIDTKLWYSAKKVGNTVEITVKNNYTPERTGKVVLNVDRKPVAEIEVTQATHDFDTYYGDSEIIQWEKATKGRGIDIILVGDGYVLDDMRRDGMGKYEGVMRDAIAAFFSVYPYSDYREYFNVWFVGAVSEEAGIDNMTTYELFDTRFDGAWAGNSTVLSSNDKTVFEFAHKIADPQGKDINDMSIIMPFNLDEYAGTCFMGSEGFSCAMITVQSESFHNVVVHEAGGHGFAKLADEYIYFPDEFLPADIIDDVTEWKELGLMDNIDLHGTVAETTWAEIAANSNYPMVGTFEGSYMYGKGIWRPEQNSCMNNNVLYFNAPSRWAQIERIMELSGTDNDYTIEEFIRDDKRPTHPVETRAASDEPFRPLGPPVLLDM